MNERTTSDADLVSAFSTDVTQLNDGRVLRFRLLCDDAPLCWSDVVDRWQNDQAFRSFFISILADAPFPAYFWETPPVTKASINVDFEFVLVNSQQLAGISTDQRAFANHFDSAQAGESVVAFSNLGRDATLVVPCPREPLSAYSQLSTFSRGAPEEQQHHLWRLVGATLEQQIGTQRIWLSTSGLGVYWMHIRFDSYPKYYTHDPYRISVR